jgi:hypothetical protein
METGLAFDGLELRRASDGSVRLEGRFPYNSPAILSDGGRNGGRPRKEKFAPGAFSFTLDDVTLPVDFLAGHSFDKPLASRKNGTLLFRDTAAALFVTAIVSPSIQRASYAQDAIAQVESGLATGLSPGFRIPPPSAVPPEEAETVEEEDPALGRALIRTIHAAILVEFSLVTRPAYVDATVEARDARLIAAPSMNPRLRWRA